MNARYRRESTHSYLILEKTKAPDYQMKMVWENHIEGLLRADIRSLNGTEELYYDITGKQSLYHLFLKRQMNYEDIRGVLLSIYHLCEEIRYYLLEEERILFMPEYCFYNTDTAKADWVFYERCEREAGLYEKLSEYIIEHMNHEDKKGIDIGYKFYKWVREEHFNIGRIVEYMDEHYPAKRIEEQNEGAESEKEPEKEVIFQTFSYEGKEEEEQSQGIWNSIVNKCKRMIIGNKKLLDEELQQERYEAAEREKWINKWREQKENACEDSGRTVLMAAPVRPIAGRFRNLENGEIISLPEQFPCIIGKDKKCADILLNSGAVSRVHARIYKQEEKLFLQDLNSKNGTFKNGVVLEPNEKVQLHQGDEIGFANLQYIYE